MEIFRLDLSEVSVGPVKFNSNELKLIRSGLWRSWAANQTLPHLEVLGALFERLEKHRKFFGKLNSCNFHFLSDRCCSFLKFSLKHILLKVLVNTVVFSQSRGYPGLFLHGAFLGNFSASSIFLEKFISRVSRGTSQLRSVSNNFGGYFESSSNIFTSVLSAIEGK